MLEFYQAYTDYQGVMDLTQELITQAVRDVTKDSDHPDGATETAWGNQKIEWTNWQRMTMREAIIHYWPQMVGFKPEMSDFRSHDAVSDLLARAIESMQAAMNAGGNVFAEKHKKTQVTFQLIRMELERGGSPGAAIASLFEAVAEENLTQPTIIYEFPTAVSPLSKQKANEPDWTERFEIYAGQMEISNGFSELNDPEDQRRRFEQQLKERERGDEEAHQMDEDYIRALSYGMPPAGGCGVGVDRLAMLLTDSHTIRDVILFPLLRPEKASIPEDTKE
jgi:lysyl-tRNA synthetase class 2